MKTYTYYQVSLRNKVLINQILPNTLFKIKNFLR